MIANTQNKEMSLKLTKSAFIWTRLLNTPFWAIFLMLPFILYKDLNADPWQVTTLVILKPSVSILSLYWSSWINKRPDRLVSNIIAAKCLACIPFFLFPFVDNPWFFVFAFGLYMMLHRGELPAWMEILKINLPGASRWRIFAWGSTFAYIGDFICPIVIGYLMDNYHQAWRWIFPVLGTLSLSSIFLQLKIPIPISGQEPETGKKSLKELLLQPWLRALDLIKRRPDFTKYQIGYILGGSGLMLIQPALPTFFEDVLNLSYIELAFAITACKSVGYALTSTSWAKLMNRLDIFRLTGWVTVLAGIFPMVLVMSQFQLVWLYVAYMIYGVMQAGSELCWHMSGTIFSRDEESSQFSSLNVLAVGVRGCFAPMAGSLIYYYSGLGSVMMLGGLLCFMATSRLWLYGKKYLTTGEMREMMNEQKSCM